MSLILCLWTICGLGDPWNNPLLNVIIFRKEPAEDKGLSVLLDYTESVASELPCSSPEWSYLTIRAASFQCWWKAFHISNLRRKSANIQTIVLACPQWSNNCLHHQLLTRGAGGRKSAPAATQSSLCGSCVLSLSLSPLGVPSSSLPTSPFPALLALPQSVCLCPCPLTCLHLFSRSSPQ